MQQYKFGLGMRDIHIAICVDTGFVPLLWYTDR